MIISERQMVNLALLIDSLIYDCECAGEDTEGQDKSNELLADWLINNQIQTL